jgi:hypothetical protein
MERRTFLKTLFAAPFVIKSGIARGVLMPVRSLVVPTQPLEFGFTSGSLILTPADFNERFIHPFAERLAQAIDEDILRSILSGVPSCVPPRVVKAQEGGGCSGGSGSFFLGGVNRGRFW